MVISEDEIDICKHLCSHQLANKLVAFLDLRVSPYPNLAAPKLDCTAINHGQSSNTQS
jgi:hypothetical protein